MHEHTPAGLRRDADHPTSALQQFNFHGAGVRIDVDEHGDPWFVAGDVARILGYSATEAMTRSLDDDEKGLRILHTPGGDQRVTVVTESGLYSAIVRSRVEGARRFKRWVTHEVLPSIRRTGAYALAPALPQDYASALRALAAEVEQRAELEAKVAADAPKVLFADAVATSHTDILVGDMAKILKGNGVEWAGAVRLFAQLRKDGYLIKRSGTDYNMPTQRSMELGLFRVKETAVTHSDGHVTVSKTPKVTGKGQAYFVKRYLGSEVAA